jgi:uncharacterized membrane protein
MADRSQNLEVIVHTNKMVVLADWLFTTPSAMVQPITGLMLANLIGISLMTPWLLVAMILYVFAGVLWLVAVYLQIQMKKIAIHTQASTKVLNNDYFKLVGYWKRLGLFSFLAMAMVFVLMVFKP